MGWAERVGWAEREGVGWAERGGVGRGRNRLEGASGSDGIEGAQRPFGRERSEPSCPGPGSAERSAAGRGPNSSYFDKESSHFEVVYYEGE